jgi:hypothetical protein
MRIYEISGIDIGAMMETFIKEGASESRPLLNEEITRDAEFVNAFVAAAKQYDIPADRLIVGTEYYPLGLAVQLQQRSLKLFITPIPVQFVAIAGSRLKFITRKSAIIYFPSDQALVENGYRFITSSREEIDQLVDLAVLKFNNSDWALQALAWLQSQTVNILIQEHI